MVFFPSNGLIKYLSMFNKYVCFFLARILLRVGKSQLQIKTKKYANLYSNNESMNLLSELLTLWHQKYVYYASGL